MAHFIAVGILVILTGCASNTSSVGKVDGVTSKTNQLRADMIFDLMSVLPQILEPLNTTVQVSDSESGYATEAVDLLVELGYGVQRVDADQGSHFLYVVELAGTTSSNESRWRVSIGDLELTRSYRIVSKNSKFDTSTNLVWRGDSGVLPAGPLKVAGTRQSLRLIGINVEVAPGGSVERYDLAASSVEYASLAPIDGGIPTISLITNDLVQLVVDSASAGPSFASLNNNNDFGNVFNGDPSAFTSLLDDYNRIVREFVIFPNDSKNLGRPGKLLVKKLISRFSENSDIIGITGCSNGSTKLAIGNEGLALGRANRIADELVAAGVSRDKIFDEGCWSPTAGGAPGFPNRGVVIDLWRRAG